MRSLRAPCTTAIERSPRFIASERFAAPEVPVSASLLHCEGRGVARAEPPTRTVAQQFTALNSEVGPQPLVDGNSGVLRLQKGNC